MEKTEKQSTKYSTKLLNRLNYQLNPHCWLLVFPFLSFTDLLSVCELDVGDDRFFTSLIKSHVIHKTLVSLNFHKYYWLYEVWTPDEILQIFRKYIKKLTIKISPQKFIESIKQVLTYCWMQNVWTPEKTLNTFGESIERLKIEISPHQFNESIKTILNFCSPGNLKEIQFIIANININQKLNIDWNLMQEAIPHFRGMKDLLIDCFCCYHDTYCELCIFFINEAKHLERVDLVGVSLEEFFDVDEFKKKLPNMEIDFNDYPNSITFGRGQHYPKLNVLFCDMNKLKFRFKDICRLIVIGFIFAILAIISSIIVTFFCLYIYTRFIYVRMIVDILFW